MAELEINWRKNLVVVWASQFLAMAGFGCCMPFIPMLLRDNLGVTDENLRGLYVAIYQFVGMVSLCVGTGTWGILADKFGRRLMLLRASYCAAFLYPLLVFAPSYLILVSIRFVAAFFSGTVNPAQTLLVTNTPEDKHGFVLGTLSTSIWSGHMAGYMLGGVIAEYLGYTEAFLCCGLMYLTSGIIVQIFVRERFVKPTSVKSKKKKHSWKELATPGVIWIFVSFLIMGISRRIDEPFIAMMVEVVNGHDKAKLFTGIVSAGASVGGVLSGVLLGWLCDKYSVYKLIVPVLLISAVSMGIHAFSPNIWVMIVSRFFVFFAAGGIWPMLQIMIAKITEPELRGSYFGLTASINQVGGLICSVLSGTVAFYLNVRWIFFTAAVFYAIMIPMAFPMIRICRKEEKLFQQKEAEKS